MEQRIAELERKIKDQENFLEIADTIIEAKKNYIDGLEAERNWLFDVIQNAVWDLSSGNREIDHGMAAEAKARLQYALDNIKK